MVNANEKNGKYNYKEAMLISKSIKDKIGKSPSSDDSDMLPKLPAFSNDWTQEMQETWLRIYWILVMKTMPPLDVKDIEHS
jgi:hypothetical protein